MILRKSFIRFIVNNHGNGKIICMGRIIKEFDKENNFLRVKPPYAYATKDQINVDVETNTNTSEFSPLKNFKYENNKIVRRTETEINAIEMKYQQDKAQRKQELQDKENQIQVNKNIIIDKNKTTQERIDAIAELVRLKKI